MRKHPSRRVMPGDGVTRCVPVIALVLVALSIPTSRASAQSTVVGADAAQTCVDTINQKRATIGLPPLARWRDGEALAASQALDDSRSNVPHGAYLQRINAGLPVNFAQNECPGWPPPAGTMIQACVSMMWNEGPDIHDGKQHGHYVNMTNHSYGQAACGFALTPSGDLWAVINIGPARSGPAAPAQATVPIPDQPPRPTQPAMSPQPAPAAADFDQDCVARINQYRATLKLAPYQRWNGGSACAAHLAAIVASGRQPSNTDTACLDGTSPNGRAWAESECEGYDERAPGEALEHCLKGAWSSGPGTDDDHQDYNNMASTQYSQAACAYQRAGDGSATIVRIFSSP